MTLDEAIRHAEEVAKENEERHMENPSILGYQEKFYDCKECAEEHRQLAEWLKELKERRQHTGHWVLVNRGLDIYMCDQCGEILQIDRVPIWDYCPVCGARMGGETDGRPNK